jgi:ABC-type polysaccharide/polyol phosphate export permease
VVGFHSLPWFLAGSLFPISALPGFLAWFAKFLPLTHGLALVRYGLLGDKGGLDSIWSMHSTALMAALSLAVVAVFAAALTAISIRSSAASQFADGSGPAVRSSRRMSSGRSS